MRTAQDWLRAALGHRETGRLPEAIDAYRRALALSPDAPNSWYNLARLEREAGRFDDALASYAEALRRGIEEPEEVHLSRGVIYADDLGRGAEAEAELSAALAANPAYLPALLNLGNLHEDRGDRAAARAAYERAGELAPGDPTVLARLAGVSRLSDPRDPLLERLRAGASAPATPAAARADLGFALGKALDALGAYDEAFAAFTAANAASRAAAGARYDRAAQKDFVDRSIALFASPSPRSAPPPRAEPPIFICGMFRSGSTLAEQILSRHRRVTSGGELPFLPALAAAMRPYPEAAARAGDGEIARLRDGYLGQLRAARPGADVATDKRPDNFLHIGLIKRLFPEARIVHTVRDPRDTILSLFFLHLDPAMAYALDLEDAAHWYGEYRRLMGHWKALYPRDIHDLDYDALVTSPRRVVGELLDFCGLDWDEACLSFHEAENVVRTASAAQVREPLYRSSSGRWRHYERHLGPLIEALRGA